ncbi:MAG TPA: hypothetical protein EYQ24_12100 [Bacteroidetes bacterium]|nr:hypothetical protein [Bacteroidota bacterium]
MSVTDPESIDWNVRLDGLIFDFDDDDLHDQRHARPAKPEAMELELTVALGGRCQIGDYTSDPFDHLCVECLIEGYSEGASTLYRTAWHLDRHGYETSPTDPVHPVYHIHFGGNALKDMEEYGHHFFLDTPRIAHPPLDVVLGIDFVLSNYFPNRRTRLMSDYATYADIVRSAQRRVWRPYSHAAARWWQRSRQPAEWSGSAVWPQLVPLRAG